MFFVCCLFFCLESYIANLVLFLRDVLKTHRTHSFWSHFLKKKIWSWGMEKQRESGREIWFHEQFTASVISFCSFVLLLSIRETVGESQNAATWREMSHGRHCFAVTFLVLCATLQEKCERCFTITRGHFISCFTRQWSKISIHF